MNPEIYDFGNKFWYNEKDQLHREDGPAAEYASGTKCWFVNGKRHRVGGPAKEWYDGSKEWYINGLRHRLDGPAEDYLISGEKYWWYNGRCIDCETQEEFERIINLKLFL